MNKEPIERDTYAEAMLGQMLRAFFLTAHTGKFKDDQLEMDNRIKDFIRGMDQNGIRVERYEEEQRLGYVYERDAAEARKLLRDHLAAREQISTPA